MKKRSRVKWRGNASSAVCLKWTEEWRSAARMSVSWMWWWDSFSSYLASLRHIGRSRERSPMININGFCCCETTRNKLLLTWISMYGWSTFRSNSASEKSAWMASSTFFISSRCNERTADTVDSHGRSLSDWRQSRSLSSSKQSGRRVQEAMNPTRCCYWLSSDFWLVFNLHPRCSCSRECIHSSRRKLHPLSHRKWIHTYVYEDRRTDRQVN